MKAITIRQPWAWAIFYAGKDVENRSWQTKVRGRVAIHAAVTMSRRDYDDACEYVKKVNSHLKKGAPISARLLALLGKSAVSEIQLPTSSALVRGAILGTVEIVDCVQHSDSVWFEAGGFGFVLARPQLLPEPIPCKGALQFWEVGAEIEGRIIDGIIE